MSVPDWPPHWAADVLLADGGTAHVRPIVSEDAPLLVDFHARLSPESVYLRFFSPHPRLSPVEIERFTRVDHRARVALVVLLGDELIGVGRYDRLGESDGAEVAFVVGDAQQGRGIATLLLERLAAAARERGLHRFSADVLPQNRAMLQVFHDAGFEVTSRFEDGVVRLDFPIDRTPEASARAAERERTATVRSLARMLAPRGIGVIAEGPAGERVAELLLRRLADAGHAGPVRRLSAFAPAGDARGLDLVFVSVPPELLPAQIERCGAWRVHAAVVLANGEKADESPAARGDRALAARARRDGLRLLGPASLGLARTAGAVRLEALALPGRIASGALALFVESPARGRDALDAATSRGIGLSTFLSGGRKADVSASDALTFWETDAETRAIGLVLRGLGNPRRTLAIARRVARKKPVLLWLADPPSAAPAALESALAHAGLVRCTALDDLLGVAQRLLAPAGSEPFAEPRLAAWEAARRAQIGSRERREPGDRFAARARVDALLASSPAGALLTPRDTEPLLACYGVSAPIREGAALPGLHLRVQQDPAWGSFLMLEDADGACDARLVPLGVRDVRGLAARAPRGLRAIWEAAIGRVASLAADVPELAALALALPSHPGESLTLVPGSARVGAWTLGMER